MKKDISVNDPILGRCLGWDIRDHNPHKKVVSISKKNPTNPTKYRVQYLRRGHSIMTSCDAAGNRRETSNLSPDVRRAIYDTLEHVEHFGDE